MFPRPRLPEYSRCRGARGTCGSGGAPAPKAEPAKVEEKEPALKEERAKFTVSTRGTLIWHEAKNVQPGAEGSTPAFRHSQSQTLRGVGIQETSWTEVRVLTSLQESSSSGIASGLPNKVPTVPAGRITVSQKIRKQHQRLPREPRPSGQKGIGSYYTARK